MIIHSERGGSMNLSSHLKNTAKVNADKTAYYFMDQKVSYAEFDGAVTRFASGLKH